MTKTIQKRADELKPGDVIQRAGGESWRVLELDSASQCKELTVWRMAPSEIGRMFHYDADNAQEFTVEATDQLVTQEQLDLLLDVAELYTSEVPASAYSDAASRLLFELRPPEPPTLQEALALLDEIDHDKEVSYGKNTTSAKMREFLDRSRRSGILKNG